MPESRALPSNRSETPSESLEDSLLLVLSSENRTNLDADVRREAYCRDVEAFSHLLHLDQNEERPKNCPQINSSVCAVLYDRFDENSQTYLNGEPYNSKSKVTHKIGKAMFHSSTCSSGSWELPVEDGTQKQLNYWSTDWKYRLGGLHSQKPLIQGTTPTFWGFAAAAHSQGGQGVALMETVSC